MTGIGTAIILRYKASTGGSDLLSYIIKSYKEKLKTSKIIFSIDVIIITLNVFFFKKLEIGLYSTIVIFIMGKMIDFIFEGINFTKVVLIISNKSEIIAIKIANKLKRGSTGVYSKGMYKKDDKIMLLCVGSRTEAYDIESIAKKEDNEAFIIILNAREVLGKGFK